MALFKKVEQLNEELGDKQGLASSYGNQALILGDWGRLEEAMTLHKKEERLKEELGDKQGLSISFVNQAVLLAENLDRKPEAIRLLDRALSLAQAMNAQDHIEHINKLIETYRDTTLVTTAPQMPNSPSHP